MVYGLKISQDIRSISPIDGYMEPGHLKDEIKGRNEKIHLWMEEQGYARFNNDIRDISFSLQQLVQNGRIKPSSVNKLNQKFVKLQTKMKMFQQKILAEEALTKERGFAEAAAKKEKTLLEELQVIGMLKIDPTKNQLQQKIESIEALLAARKMPDEMRKALINLLSMLKQFLIVPKVKNSTIEKFNNIVEEFCKKEEAQFASLRKLAKEKPEELAKEIMLHDLTEEQRASLLEYASKGLIDSKKANKFWESFEHLFKTFGIKKQYLKFNVLRNHLDCNFDLQWELGLLPAPTNPLYKAVEMAVITIRKYKEDDRVKVFHVLDSFEICLSILRDPITTQDILWKWGHMPDALFQLVLKLSRKNENTVAETIEQFHFDNAQCFEIAKTLVKHESKNFVENLEKFGLSHDQLHEVFAVGIQFYGFDFRALLKANFKTEENFKIIVRALKYPYNRGCVKQLIPLLNQFGFSDKQLSILSELIMNRFIHSNRFDNQDEVELHSFLKHIHLFRFQDPNQTLNVLTRCSTKSEHGHLLLDFISKMNLDQSQCVKLISQIAHLFPRQVVEKISLAGIRDEEERFKIALLVAPKVDQVKDWNVDNFRLTAEHAKQVDRLAVVNHIVHVETYLKKYDIKDEKEIWQVVRDAAMATPNKETLKVASQLLTKFGMVFYAIALRHYPQNELKEVLSREGFEDLQKGNPELFRGLRLMQNPLEELPKDLLKEGEPFTKLYKKARGMKAGLAQEKTLKWLGYFDMLCQHHPHVTKEQIAISLSIVEEILQFPNDKIQYALTELLFEHFHENFPHSAGDLKELNHLLPANHTQLFRLVLLHPAFKLLPKEKLAAMAKTLNSKEYHSTQRVIGTLEGLISILNNRALTVHQKTHLISLSFEPEKTNKETVISFNEALASISFLISSNYLAYLLSAKQKSEIKTLVHRLIEELCPGIDINRFIAVLNQSRRPDAIFLLADSIAKTHDPILKPELERLCRVLTNGTFKEERYSGKDREHFKMVFGNRPELLAEWRKGEETVLPNGWKCIDTDAWDDLLLCGEEVSTLSCLKLSGGSRVNCIFGMLFDPKIRLIAIKDQKGEIVARAIIRLLCDKKTGEPVFQFDFVQEKAGQDKKMLEEEILKMAAKRAQALKVPFVRLWYDNKSKKHPDFDLVSHGTTAPYEQVQAKLLSETTGIYTIESQFLEVM